AEGAGRVQPFRTDTHAVHDAAAAEQRERVVQLAQALVTGRIAAVRQEAVALQQRRRAEELLRVPPERRAARGAAGAQDALVQAVELLALFRALQTLDGRCRGVVDQVRAHLLVLVVE